MRVYLVGNLAKLWRNPNPGEPFKKLLPEIWSVLDSIRHTWKTAPGSPGSRFVQWVTLPNGDTMGIVLSVRSRDAVYAHDVALF
ncbi:MAG: hypothetical protein KAV82_03635 [Phycisphaerae bacterium]|nr:hypothetical protein [Phycisphaerae bacterium]